MEGKGKERLGIERDGKEREGLAWPDL